MRSRNFHRIALAASASMVLAGCGSLSGLDSADKFSCAAPDGVTCMSISGIYANAKANNLPSQNAGRSVGTVEQPSGKSSGTTRQKNDMDYFSPPNNISTGSTVPKNSPASFAAPNFGSPLRTPERILRVWLAPFEDTQGDLHDQKYVYVQVHKGQWTIEANKAQIRNKYRQVRPLSGNNPANKQAEEKPLDTNQAAMDTVFNSQRPNLTQQGPVGSVGGFGGDADSNDY